MNLRQFGSVIAVIVLAEMIVLMGCNQVKYIEKDPNLLIKETEKVYHCKFPRGISEVKSATFTYRDATSIVMKFNISNPDYNIFVNSFPAKAEFDRDGDIVDDPWGTKNNRYSSMVNVPWWDPGNLRRARKVTYDNPDFDFAVKVLYLIVDEKKDIKVVYLRADWAPRSSIDTH